MLELPTQPSCTVLENANVCATISMKEYDDDTGQLISENKYEVQGESTLSSDIEDDHWGNQQEVLHLDQARHNMTIRTTRVPQPKKWSHADTVVAHTFLPNLRHPARAIVAPLLKHQKSTITIWCKSDVVPPPPPRALPLPKTGGHQNGLEENASGDHNILHHQMVTFEVVKQFMEPIIFTTTPWPMILDEMYSMVNEALKLAIKSQHCQCPLTGTPVVIQSVCELPAGPSLEFHPQTRHSVSVYSVFCSSIGLMMILNPRNIGS